MIYSNLKHKKHQFSEQPLYFFRLHFLRVRNALVFRPSLARWNVSGDPQTCSSCGQCWRQLDAYVRHLKPQRFKQKAYILQTTYSVISEENISNLNLISLSIVPKGPVELMRIMITADKPLCTEIALGTGHIWNTDALFALTQVRVDFNCG